MKLNKKSGTEGVIKATHFLPLELVVEYPEIGKRELDKEWAAELKESIRANGLDTPLLVWDGGEEAPMMKVGTKEVPSNFLVAGFHRREALRSLRKEDSSRFENLFPQGIPVRRFSGSLGDMIALQLRENLDRQNPEAEEVLPQVLRLRDEFKLKQKQIARKIGRSEAYVSQLLAVEEELGKEGVEEVVKGGVSAKHAMRAAKDVRKGKSSKEQAIKSAKEKSAKQKAAGRDREEKRVSFGKLWGRFKALPAMEDDDAFAILQKMCRYVAGEIDTLPKELKADAAKKSKTEDEDEE